MVGIAERNQALMECRNRLDELNSGSVVMPPVWRRFQDDVTKMPPEQRASVEVNDAVLEAKRAMNSLFIELLFEQHKCRMVSDPRFEQAAERYVDAVESAAAAFVQKNRTLAEENEALKAEIARLKAEAI